MGHTYSDPPISEYPELVLFRVTTEKGRGDMLRNWKMGWKKLENCASVHVNNNYQLASMTFYSKNTPFSCNVFICPLLIHPPNVMVNWIVSPTVKVSSLIVSFYSQQWNLFTVGDKTYVGIHRTVPVSFITNCKNLQSLMKLLQSVTQSS